MKCCVSLLVVIILGGPFTWAQDDYLNDFAKKWENAADYTLEVAELMPAEDYDFRPTPEIMTFGGQLQHMLRNMLWLSGSYLGGEKAEFDLSGDVNYGKDELLSMLRQGFRLSKEAVSQLAKADLQEPVTFFAGPMNKRQIVTLMNDHMTHHRGQIIIYLRLKGIKPPPYRGW